MTQRETSRSTRCSKCAKSARHGRGAASTLSCHMHALSASLPAALPPPYRPFIPSLCTVSLPHCSTASPLQGAPERAATATPDSPRPGWGRHPAGGVRRAALPAIAAPSGQVRYRGGQLRHTLGAGETLDTSETLATPLRPDDLKISPCRPGVEFARPCVHPPPRDQ